MGLWCLERPWLGKKYPFHVLRFGFPTSTTRPFRAALQTILVRQETKFGGQFGRAKRENLFFFQHNFFHFDKNTPATCTRRYYPVLVVVNQQSPFFVDGKQRAHLLTPGKWAWILSGVHIKEGMHWAEVFLDFIASALKIFWPFKIHKCQERQKNIQKPVGLVHHSLKNQLIFSKLEKGWQRHWITIGLWITMTQNRTLGSVYLPPISN